MKKKIKFIIKRKQIARIWLIFVILISAFFWVSLNNTNYNLIENPNTNAEDNLEDSLLWKIGKGFPGFGSTMQPRFVNFTNNGDSFIVVGTDGGMATISLDGIINCSYNTFGPVIDFDLIDDISGDDMKEIVLISYTQDYANVIAISSNNGSEIWKFKPTIRGIDQETYKTQDFITYTWDIEVINDINNDFISDIVICSWFRLFVIDGKTGQIIWKNDLDFENDIWKLAIIDDINNNGFETIIAGSEEGKLIAFDSKFGTKHWTYKVAETSIRGYGLAGYTTYEVPNSIDEIKVINDINNDDVDDILVAADDGYLRLLSGNSGNILDHVVCYNVTIPQSTYGQLSSSPYSSVERIFKMSGIKILEIPDIDEDGKGDYLSIACNLDYPSDYYSGFDSQQPIQGRIFSVNSDTGLDYLEIIMSLNWTIDPFYRGSAPLIIKEDTNIDLYFYKRTQMWYDEYHIERYSINDKNWENGLEVYAEESYYTNEENPFSDCNECYLYNIVDPNNEGINYIFAIGVKGRYLLIESENNEIIWDRSKKTSTIELKKIQDLNLDGIPDFLIQQKSIYDSEWFDPSQIDFGGEEFTIISNLFAIDATSGKTLWNFILPSPNLYEGLRDLVSLGDINDDDIGDYAGWIIPSSIPDDISEIIEKLSGQEVIQHEKKYDLYRVLLCKYIKLIVIDGSNGDLLWNTPLVDFPYKFYRQFEYEGSYEDPVFVDINDYNIFNRINGKIPATWVTDYDITWDEYWDITTLNHANNITNVKGQSLGTIFDTWGNQNTNYTVSSHNSSSSSKSLKIGSTSNPTSIGTIEEGDDQFWQIYSTEYGDDYVIQIELSFNQSTELESELKHIEVDYTGSLSSSIDRYDISIYNSSNGGLWQKISSDVINNSLVQSMTKMLYNIDNLTSGEDNLVKLKIEAANSSTFTLSLDEVLVRYSYTHQNYTVEAENDGMGWKSIIDVEIPLDLSDKELLGVMEYPLSQIDRLSALKMQTRLKINTSDLLWYNFTYEIYDVVNKKWVLCNWSNEDNTWNNHTYSDLRGDYDTNYRNDYLDFQFSEVNYRNDQMWVLTRGTKDSDPFIEFDYENKTTLSNFINSNKEIRIRLNITNANFRFKVTFDHFGIGAFYWGLFNNEYDETYLWNYNEYGGVFDTTNILNLQIQDFEIINGNGDEFNDILIVIGNEDEWSTRLCLFDIKNKVSYEKWDINGKIIPLKDVRVLSLNSSINNWILTGIYDNGSDFYCSHKLVANPHWSEAISHFDNYSTSLISMGYDWEFIPNFPEYYYDSTPYEFPGKVNITKTGKVGVLIGEYALSEDEHSSSELEVKEIRIINVVNNSTVSTIPTQNIIKSSHDIGTIDFCEKNLGFLFLLSDNDFNGDNILDHIAIYRNDPDYEHGYFHPSIEIKVIDGCNEGSDVVIDEIRFEEMYYGYEVDYSKLPVSSIGDVNNDNIPEVIVGLQSSEYECKGSTIQFFDVFNDQQLTEATWELEIPSCLYYWASQHYDLYTQVKSIEDINLDGYEEVFVEREYSLKTTDSYGYSYYTRIPTTEIVDVLNKQILYRFNLDVDSLLQTNDLNGDGKKELIIVSDELVYCINSKFKLDILSPQDQQTTSSNNFEIKWETGASYDYFEVFVNTVSQGQMTAKSIILSLSAGWKEITLVMHDKSGLIISISTIRVLVPENFTYLTLTIALLGVTIGGLVFYRKFSKKKQEKILIHKEHLKGGEN